MTDHVKFGRRIMFGLGYTVLYKSLYDYKITMQVAFQTYESTKQYSVYTPILLN